MSPDVELSDRELEILRLVATGASNKEIALKLVISPNTVKVHLRNIFSKIGAVSRTEAALFALRTGLVDHVAPPIVLPEENGAAGLPDTSSALSSDLPPEVLLDSVEESLPQPDLRAFPNRRFWLAAVFLVLIVVLAVGATILLRGSAELPFVPTSTTLAAASLVDQRWQDETSLPQARQGMASAVYENAFYILGGETPDGVTGSTLRFQLNNNRWDTLADKPTPVTDVQSAVIGEQIYVPGGRKADGQPTNLFEVYNLRLNQWRQLPLLPAALSGYALAALDGRLYLFGGWDGAQAVASVYMFDPETNAWQPRSPLSSRRAFGGAVALEGRIYLIGGMDDVHPLTTMQVYFPQRDQEGAAPYEERAALPEARSKAGTTVIAGLVYVFGGQGDTQPEGGLPPLQYAPVSDHWTSFERSPVAIGALPALVPLETRLHILGGSTPGGISAFHQSYQAIYTIVLPSIRK